MTEKDIEAASRPGDPPLDCADHLANLWDAFQKGKKGNRFYLSLSAKTMEEIRVALNTNLFAMMAQVESETEGPPQAESESPPLSSPGELPPVTSKLPTPNPQGEARP